MRGDQRGFTLIELMIVVAIIGILASIAVPAAQGYMARSKVSEAVLFMAACRTSVSEVYQSSNTAPAANKWGCGEGTVSSKYVSSLATNANGVVSVTLRNISGDVDGKVIVLVPMKSATVAAAASDVGTRLFGWICGGTGTTVPANMLPSSCRGS